MKYICILEHNRRSINFFYEDWDDLVATIKILTVIAIARVCHSGFRVSISSHQSDSNYGWFSHRERGEY